MNRQSQRQQERMSIGRVAFGIVVIIVLCSIIVSNLASLVSVDVKENSISSGNKFDIRELQNNLKLDDDPKNVMVFLQISDIHLSKFKDPSRVKDLKKFCEKVVGIVKPSVVVASGDLTDAKGNERFNSKQFHEEWTMYQNALTETNVTKITKWLDIRGNHDNFNVPGLLSKDDLFIEYSVQGKQNPRSYMQEVQAGDLKYSFIAIDASLEPGPKRPYNFIGFVSKEELSNLEKMVNTSREHGNNFIVWFAHYPTSCMSTTSGSPSVRKFIGQYDETVAYLSGHLHTLGQLVHRMYAIQKEGFLELELGDFLKQRRYRLAAFDNGLFSFTDVELNTWPLVLITNPKDILFNIPDKENLNLQIQSTHIRILAYSLAPIGLCKLRIDTETTWKLCEKSSTNENFFAVPWEPFKYSKGIHKIELLIGDADGRTQVIYHDFSLDGTRLNFDFLARFVLMMGLNTMFKVFFTIAFVLCTFPIVFFRVWHVLVKTGKMNKPKIKSQRWRKFVQKYWILASIDRLAFGLLFYCFYMVSCPWSFVELLDGHLGVVFLWGMYLPWSSFLPPNLSYLFGGLQLLYCQFPMTIVIAGAAERRFYQHLAGTQVEESIKTRLVRNIPLLLIMMAEIVLAVVFCMQYGILALLISPLRLWGSIFNIILWYQATTLPNLCLSSASMIWSSDAKTDITDT